MRRLIFILVSILVSGVFLWLAMRDVPLDDLFAAIGQANVPLVLVSFGSVTLALFLRGVRWQVLIGGRMTFMQCSHIFNVGMFINMLPLRAGEVARVVLATRFGVPVFTSGASIVVERLLDVVMVLIVLAVGLSRAPSVPEGTGRAAVLFSIVAVIGFAVLIVFARFPRLPHAIIAWLEGRIGALKRLNLARRVDEVLDGLRIFTHPATAVRAIGWTLVGWAVSLVTYWSLLIAFNVPSLVPDVDMLSLACMGLALASLGVALPVTVAGIGPFQGASRVAGELAGVPSAVSAAIGVVFHGVTYITYGAWGIIGLLALGVRLGDVMRAGEKAPDTASQPQ
jgi:uncharacterized protein (TIRG00374 family)